MLKFQSLKMPIQKVKCQYLRPVGLALAKLSSTVKFNNSIIVEVVNILTVSFKFSMPAKVKTSSFTMACLGLSLTWA